MTENEYARFVYDILDMVDEMKLSGDYPEYTGLEPYGTEIQDGISITEQEGN